MSRWVAWPYPRRPLTNFWRCQQQHCRAFSQKSSRNPNQSPHYLWEEYCNTPPIFIAMLSLHLGLEEREILTKPFICSTVRLSLSTLLCRRSTGGWGHQRALGSHPLKRLRYQILLGAHAQRDTPQGKRSNLRSNYHHDSCNPILTQKSRRAYSPKPDKARRKTFQLAPKHHMDECAHLSVEHPSVQTMAFEALLPFLAAVHQPSSINTLFVWYLGALPACAETWDVQAEGLRCNQLRTHSCKMKSGSFRSFPGRQVEREGNM